ncbi:TonB-dependent receptor domain-containing protein [Sphingomonas sp.]|uniref:TonB-dependent receptor domain-containing protein n=1 Tax=Sphingomonas sp. TaxID=28214 RepID=UPI003CC68E1A
MPSPAAAQAPVAVSLPPTTLDLALMTLSRAAGVDIISTEPGLRQVRTRAVAGRLTVRVALERLLAGTGFRAVSVPGIGFRIVPAPVAHARPRAAPPPQVATGDVVVTASKQRITLLAYPGTLTRLAGAPTLPGGAAAAPSDLARILPVMQSTQLGPGRNKVFIRGVADSSFNGTTLSTVSVYLDDVQLSASGPDPGLRLYDLRSVEVMEGPQGTLYGAGSIGGVVRLSSNPPDLGRVEASIDAGVSAIRSGEPGGDLAAMLNLPLADDRLAVRAVGYVVHDGGYLNDASRRVRHVNDSDTAGGRVNLAWAPGDGWHIEAGGALQAVRARDGQYAQAGVGPLTRRAVIAQPFDGDFHFGRAVIEKTWDSDLHFVAATGVSAYDTSEVFDATPAGTSPTVTSHVDTTKLLLSQELRLSRSTASGRSWLIGATLIDDRSVLFRSAGSLGSEADIIGVRNVTRAGSAFGEGTVTFFRDLSVTLGARYTIARVDSEPSQIPRAAPYVKGQKTSRVDPTVALSWRVAPGLAVFARHQTGFRTGGLAVARGVGRVANFEADSINVNEIGLRRLKSSPRSVQLSLSVSDAHWRDIQADLLSRRGQPYTANIGDAIIRGVEAAFDWQPIAGLRLAGSGLYTANMVTGAIAAQSQRSNRRLPETPALAGYAEVSYALPGARRYAPSMTATLTYAGPSVLGTGDLLDIRQGGYVLASAAAGLRRGRYAVSLRVDNLLDSRADRFAFGNPAGFALRDQRTPLQPRTLRMCFSSAW